MKKSTGIESMIFKFASNLIINPEKNELHVFYLLIEGRYCFQKRYRGVIFFKVIFISVIIFIMKINWYRYFFVLIFLDFRMI